MPRRSQLASSHEPPRLNADKGPARARRRGPDDGEPRGERTAGAKIGVVMGSQSDYQHMGAACDLLRSLGIPFEARVVSAHRTPDWLFEYATAAEARGLHVLIAGAGGAAHLPGMLAAKTLIPVLGVPVPATQLNGLDALLSIVQMPKGVPVGTLAIGASGAANAALLAAEILALHDPALRSRLHAWRDARREEVLAQTLPPSAAR